MAIALPAASLVATVALNLSIAVAVGASLSSAWLQKGTSPWAARQLRGLRTMILAASGTAIASHIALLWMEAASMAEVPFADAAPAVHTALTATHYGYAWAIGFGSLIVIAIATAAWPRAAAVVRFPALGGFLYSRSIVSHAAAAGDVNWAVAVDWLHLVLVSAWIGAVLVAGLATLRPAPGAAPVERSDRAGYVLALSHSATIALIGIFGTGMVSAWRGLGSLDNAAGNPYATILWIKLAFVGSAALLGAVNRFRVMPGLLDGLRGTAGAPDSPHRKFAAILQVEAIFLLLALSAAAVLSSTSPPMAG